MHTFQVRLYTSAGIVTPEEIPAIKEYFAQNNERCYFNDFTANDFAKKALHLYCTLSPVIGGEVIKVDSIGHYRTTYRFANV